ncbi:EamA family transporter [Candidatus Woesearchaeota archaeon]|nr:EamA family transporter [Candidatus Woesearchaeota archaeon]
MLKEDTLSFVCLMQFVAAIFFIPMLILEFALPRALFPWLIVIIASALWALASFVYYEAHSLVPVSIKAPLDESKLVFILFLSVLILSESLFLEKVIGIFVMFTGLLILAYKKKGFLKNVKDKGTLLILGSAFLLALVSIVDKYALRFFTPGTYGFLVYFIPGLILVPFLINKKQEAKKLVRESWKLALIAVLFSVVAYYFRLKAFDLAEVSLVFPITRLSVLIAVFGGIIFLKEREYVWRKLIASVIVIIGAILLAGTFNF